MMCRVCSTPSISTTVYGARDTEAVVRSALRSSHGIVVYDTLRYEPRGIGACMCRVVDNTWNSLMLAEAVRAAERWGGYTAVRVWRYYFGRLRSVAANDIWQNPMAPAECLIQDHEAPARGCGCGFWALFPGCVRELDRVDEWSVVGVVEPTGKVIVGTYGWRASGVMIREIWLRSHIYDGLIKDRLDGITWHIVDV